MFWESPHCSGLWWLMRLDTWELEHSGGWDSFSLRRIRMPCLSHWGPTQRQQFKRFTSSGKCCRRVGVGGSSLQRRKGKETMISQPLLSPNFGCPWEPAPKSSVFLTSGLTPWRCSCGHLPTLLLCSAVVWLCQLANGEGMTLPHFSLSAISSLGQCLEEPALNFPPPLQAARLCSGAPLCTCPAQPLGPAAVWFCDR